MRYDSWVRAVPQAPGRVDRIVALGMAAAVPSQYQSAYSVVDAEVQNFARGGSGSTQPTRTTIGTELLSANGNIGSSLLAPEAIVGVDNELNAFQALGIRGVTVDVSFPLPPEHEPQCGLSALLRAGRRPGQEAAHDSLH